MKLPAMGLIVGTLQQGKMGSNPKGPCRYMVYT